MKKNGQAFVIDIIIAVSILCLISILYFSFYTNQNIKENTDYSNLLSEAKTISDYLTTQGYPNDWNQTNVVRLGLFNSEKILDKSKLNSYSNITTNDYYKTKEFLNTKYDYIMFFKAYNGSILNLSTIKYYGMPGVNDTNIDLQKPRHLTKISRFIVEKNVTAQIIEMIIYVWSKT